MKKYVIGSGIVLSLLFVFFSFMPKPPDAECKKMVVYTSEDQIDRTPYVLTWEQDPPQPDYWELRIQTLNCGEEDIIKTFTTKSVPFTYIPDEEFPGYHKLQAFVCAVLNDKKSDWSNAVILKR